MCDLLAPYLVGSTVFFRFQPWAVMTWSLPTYLGELTLLPYCRRTVRGKTGLLCPGPEPLPAWLQVHPDTKGIQVSLRPLGAHGEVEVAWGGGFIEEPVSSTILRCILLLKIKNGSHIPWCLWQTCIYFCASWTFVSTLGKKANRETFCSSWCLGSPLWNGITIKLALLHLCKGQSN